MSVTCQLAWREGDILTPQHFQFLNAYLQELARQSERNAHPYYWGAHYTLDEPALQRGTLKIDWREAVMRDGTRLCVQGVPPNSNAGITARNFADILDAYGNPLGVYLGLKPVPWVEPLDTHYACALKEAEVVDLHAADHRYPVAYLIYEVEILFENELEQYRDWTVLKIAVVRRSPGDTGFQLDDHYIPPCRSIQASAPLVKMLAALRDLLWRKAHEWEGSQPHNGVRLHLPLLQVLGSYHQALQHTLETQATHPYEAYGLLRQLLGALAPFSNRFPGLPMAVLPYQHDRLWECFDSVIQHIARLLSEPLAGPSRQVQLVYNQESKSYAAVLPDEFLVPHGCFYLAVQTTTAGDDLEHILNKKCKISAPRDLPALKTGALDGVHVQMVMPPPHDVPYLAHYRYFKVSHQAPLWRQVAQDKHLVVYCGDNTLPEGTKMLLYSVPVGEEC